MSTATYPSTSSAKTKSSGPDFHLAQDGTYCIKNYDQAPAFCSFLPGIAGRNGVPLWCLYVNRGQAIASFGVHNKDNAILEFLPATWAYQLVGVQGFRTFLRCSGDVYEPFSASSPRSEHLNREMRIGADRLSLTEYDIHRGLRITVEYFSPPDQPIGMLVRRLSITNTATTVATLELLDGLPLIMPAGVGDGSMKGLRHITEAYAYVRHIGDEIPFFAAKVAVHDEAEIQAVRTGNFYAAYRVNNEKLERLRTYVDPHVIFGGGQDLVTPRHFVEGGLPNPDQQILENRLACALAADSVQISPQETHEIVSLVGSAPTAEMAEQVLTAFHSPAQIEAASEASANTIGQVTDPAFTVSEYPAFNAYSRQNYLDNVLRGGVPVTLPSKEGKALHHVYARRHGDLERDYNYFVLPPTPLSAGAGNYRDICQNRRYDVWFYPEVGSLEIRMFLSLLQADGYNPLGVTGSMWKAEPGLAEKVCPTDLPEATVAAFCKILSAPFQPGALLAWCDQHGVEFSDRSAWLNEVLEQCSVELIAAGHEGGYWVDHWTYVVDLLESYAGIYPDRVTSMLNEQADITWFDEGARIQPRATKYQARQHGPMQLNTVVTQQPAQPELPKVTPLAKLAALISIKAVSFDANLRGIEMEAGRPGWNDSMNGLPGLFGSSSCEAAELARLARWVHHAISDGPVIKLPRVVAEFCQSVAAELSCDYDWNRATTLRERFVAELADRDDAAVELIEFPAGALVQLIELAEQRALQAVANARDEATGLTHTYFENHPLELGDSTTQSLGEQIRSFESRPLPLFLEGQVHAMRLMTDAEQAREVYATVRSSGLYDQKLEMYKLNECLDRCGHDIGRARTFTRGWFENESIWLHMSYKYLLELLRAGLTDEYYQDLDTMLVPFMDPHVYGRSILENSSFLGSSANPDPATHGRGFIARLSGSSAEFIQMWLMMTVGNQPFTLDQSGELCFAVSPQLPGAWFTTEPQVVEWRGISITVPENSFACALFGEMLLIYRNPSRKDTFGSKGVQPKSYKLDGQQAQVVAQLKGAEAKSIREHQIQTLVVELG